MSNITLPLTSLYSSIHDDLAIVERIFDEELAGESASIDDMCATVRSYRGKMLRPALLLLCGKATGELSHAHHVLAAVVEMIRSAKPGGEAPSYRIRAPQPLPLRAQLTTTVPPMTATPACS